MSANEAVCTEAEAPPLIIAAMFVAANFPMMPDGMPVRGGEGAMTVPAGDFLGSEIW
jgi:hypothetical protein